ncbi:MAG: MGMT family protein [Planctomycetota bacterium]
MAAATDHHRMRSDRPADSHLRVLTVVRRIPPGFVCTYGRVADAADMPRCARMVGRILRDSPLSAGVPWHRVISASGRISERGGPGGHEQRRLLENEGVVFDANGKVDLSAYMWRPLQSNR